MLFVASAIFVAELFDEVEMQIPSGNTFKPDHFCLRVVIIAFVRMHLFENEINKLCVNSIPSFLFKISNVLDKTKTDRNV